LTEEIRRIERGAGVAEEQLMLRAAAAAADVAMRIASDKAKDILVLAGPGNNGGDARVVARLLKEKFFRVELAAQMDQVPARPWGLIIDGLFGIGLARELTGEYAALVDYTNRQRCPVLALDIPSGLHSDTGRVLGHAVHATHTVTFIALKPGLLTLEGPDHCGVLEVADLGLDARKIVAPSAWIADPATFKALLKPRPRNFHKGMAGSLAILGGAAGMTGAALLAGRAALKMGSGRVYVGLLDESQSLDGGALELMLRHPDDALGQDLDAIVAGPGIGQGERAETLVGAVLASDLPCVLDADALNLIAESEDLRHACARRSADTIVTPHPAEAARLLALKTADVQADRAKAAKILAENLNAHVVLKGAGSILVARDRHWFVNTTGHAGMASAGMGDVLAGILGALLAQRYSGESSLVLGVHLHGAAADELVKRGIGPVGLTAGEVIDAARRQWNAWLGSEPA
jgi:hydroxyethylthiazole kinase-like uncharacterized protein yjeF